MDSQIRRQKQVKAGLLDLPFFYVCSPIGFLHGFLDSQGETRKHAGPLDFSFQGSYLGFAKSQFLTSACKLWGSL